MKRLNIACLVFLLIGILSPNAVIAGQWAKAYGGTGNESGCIWPTKGGYYLSGDTTSATTGIDGLFAKLTTTGAVTFAKKIGGSADDELTVTPQGTGYLVTGMTKSFGTPGGNYNLLWAKFTSAWKPVYQKVFGGRRDEGGTFIDTSDGGLIFIGMTYTYLVNDGDFLLMKINSAGSISWKKVLNAGLIDSLAGVIEVADGFVVSGSITPTGSYFPGIFVMKLNKTTGAVIWKKSFSYPATTMGSLYGGGLVKLADGNILVTGTVFTTTDLNSKGVIFKLNSSTGGIHWQKTYSSPSFGIEIDDEIENSDHSLLISGAAVVDGTDYSILILKLNATGSILLKKRLGAATAYNTGMIQKMSTGELLLSGEYAKSSLSTNWNVFYGKLTQTPTNITVAWAKTFGGTKMEGGEIEKLTSGYLLNGTTYSFGKGTPTTTKGNIFGLILDANGNYPGCYVSSISLPVSTPAITTANAGLITTTPKFTTRTWAGSPTNASLTVQSVTLPSVNICAPVTTTTASEAGGASAVAGEYQANDNELSTENEETMESDVSETE